MTVRMDEMSWTEIREKLKGPNAIILPLGSAEEHGAHLPVNFDSACATYLAEHAAQKVMDEHKISVLVAPTIDYTDVSLHKMFPGTIGVKPDTLIKVLVDIIENFLYQGFNNIIVLTAHRENRASVEVACTLIADDHPDANIYAITSVGGLGFDVRPGLEKAGLPGIGHALELETSMAMVIEPHLVHLEKAVIGARKLPISARYLGETGKDTSKGILYCSGITGFEESGTFGDPTMATKEEGEIILPAMIKDLADITVQVVKSRT